jgi:Tfp pilus assembly protein PilF
VRSAAHTTLSTVRRIGPWLACLVVFLAPALSCKSAASPWSLDSSTSDPYRQLAPADVEELRRGIELLEQGHLTEAGAVFSSLADKAPGDLATAVWQQEARMTRALESADQGAPADGLQAALRDGYRRQAEEGPTPLSWYLAARLEEDPMAAQLLLRRALELDPRMSWAHYAQAHVAARDGDWSAARQALERTFDLVPDHLPALRLYGWFQAEAGNTASAIEAFEAWLERSDQDWLVTARRRDEVRLDLALAYHAEGQGESAARLLRELEPGTVDEVRRLTAIAMVEQDRGYIQEALGAARAARAAQPTATLPAVQEALLLELWLEDSAGARAAWEEVLALTSESDDLADGLQRFRAEVHLQRLMRAAEVGVP